MWFKALVDAILESLQGLDWNWLGNLVTSLFARLLG
jgi:hypothetical protein